MKEKIKIFYAIQVSNFTNNNDGKPKWLLRNDACTNIAVGIVSALLDKYDNLEFVLKLPHPDDTIDVEDLYEFFDSKYYNKVTFFHDSIPISPVTSRFNFDYHFYYKNKDKFKDIDVMINDENTLTKNWNVFFDSIDLKIPIISTNYFLDSPIAKKVNEKIRYYERQMESFINSDIAAFQCEAGRLEAMDAYDYLYKTREPLTGQSVWGVGCHAAEIIKYHTRARFINPTIYFGNRITETANRYTNWDSFAEAIGKLDKMTKIPFRAVMLNPTRKITDEQLKEIEILSNGRIEVLSNDESFTREEYLKFINHAHISVNLFVTEVHGGVTHCEALLANNQVIMPKINNYWHKFKNAGYKNYPLFCKVNGTKPDIDSLTDKMILALNNVNTIEEFKLIDLCYAIGYKYESYESAVERIYADIITLYNKRYGTKFEINSNLTDSYGKPIK